MDIKHGRTEQPEYHDQDGNPISLNKLCRTEPEWAAARIAFMRVELERLHAVIKQETRTHGTPYARATVHCNSPCDCELCAYLRGIEGEVSDGTT